MEGINVVFLFEKGNLVCLEGEIKDELKKTFLTIKEAIDFSGLPISVYSIYFDNSLFYIEEIEEEKFLIIFGEKGIDIEKIKEEIEKKKEVEKPAEKKVKEEVVEEVVPEEIFDEVFEITVKHLSAFGEMVFENTLKDMRIEKKNTTLKKFRQFVRKLGASAQMIVGPSKSQEMVKEILNLLK